MVEWLLYRQELYSHDYSTVISDFEYGTCNPRVPFTYLFYRCNYHSNKNGILTTQLCYGNGTDWSFYIFLHICSNINNRNLENKTKAPMHNISWLYCLPFAVFAFIQQHAILKERCQDKRGGNRVVLCGRRP